MTNFDIHQPRSGADPAQDRSNNFERDPGGTPVPTFPDPALAAVPIFTFVLVKLASRCNIDCTYCYWFRDAEVYKKPPVLTLEAEDAFCEKLEEHIKQFELDTFMTVFHGGEPLLFPKRRFVALQEKLNAIEKRTRCSIQRGVTTNAILIDQEWIKIFAKYDVIPSVSLDGPAEIHDKSRVDFKGKGTHAATMRGIDLLRAAGLVPGLISVCNPATDPAQLLAYIVDDLGVKEFDILPPDANHRDNPPPIADYFIKLFDVWYDTYAARGVRISTIDAMIRGLSGHLSICDTIGLGPVDTVTLMTDGTLEPLDVLRIAGDGSTVSLSSVFANQLQDVQNDPRWLAAFRASLALPEVCRACEFLDGCGGGHLAQRWSPERQYDNPSVYCESWKRIFNHIWERISPTLIVNLESAAAH
jgi:uncharacterized protein